MEVEDHTTRATRFENNQQEQIVWCLECPEQIDSLTSPKTDRAVCCAACDGVISQVSQMSNELLPKFSRGTLIKLDFLAGSEPLTVMIDTGAELNVIYASSFERILRGGAKVRETNRHMKIRGALGEKAQTARTAIFTPSRTLPSGEIWSVELECVILECPQNLQCADVILGRPTQRELQMTISPDDTIAVESTKGERLLIYETESPKWSPTRAPLTGKTLAELADYVASLSSEVAVGQTGSEVSQLDIEWNLSQPTSLHPSEPEIEDDRQYAIEQLDLIPSWDKPEYKTLVSQMVHDLPGIATRAVKLASRRKSAIEKGLPILPQATITLKPNAQLPRHQAQRLNITMMKHLENKIRPLERAGVIARSISPNASRAMIIGKQGKVNEFRLVCDYRDLNVWIERNSYNIPRVSDCISRLRGGKIFSTMDLASYFDQLTLAPESRRLTAFICALGTYEYAGLPQGLSISPNFAQFIINLVFAKDDEFGSFQNVIEYIDDLVVKSENEGDHPRDVQRVLQRLWDYGIQVSLKKSIFFVKKFTFLGHEIDAETDPERTLIRPAMKTVQAIQNFPRPRCQLHVQQLLGMINFFHTLIEDCAVITAPIADLSSINWAVEENNSASDLWTEKHENAFLQIKQALTSGPVLQLPDDSLPYRLQMDASNRAFGGVLMQINPDGTQHAVLYVSKKFSKQQLNWSTSEKELFSLVYVIRKYGYLFYGSAHPITYVCDHKPLANWERWTLTPKLARWMDTLNSVAWNFEYVEGPKNTLADALSRNPNHLVGDAVYANKWENVKNLTALKIDENSDLHFVESIIDNAVAAAELDETDENEVLAVRETKFEDWLKENPLDSDEDPKMDLELNEPAYEPLEHQIQRDIQPTLERLQKDDRFGRDAHSWTEFQHTDDFWNEVGNNNVLPPTPEFLLKLQLLLRDDDDDIMTKLTEKDPKISQLFVLSPNGFIYRLPEGNFTNKRLYIPRNAIETWKRIIAMHHDDPFNGGHHGFSKTLAKIQRNYWWTGMQKDVKNHCSTCVPCQRSQPTTRRQYFPSAHPRPSHCFQVIAIDEKTSLPLTKRGNKSVWIFVDYLSRMVILEAAPESMTAEQLSHVFLTRIVRDWGFPSKIVSDRGTQFTSKAWDALTKTTGAKKNLASTGNPKTAGLAERAIKQFLDSLRKFIESLRGDYASNWDLMLPFVQFAFNDSVNDRTGFTPFELATGRSPNVPIECFVNAEFPIAGLQKESPWPMYEKDILTSRVPVDYVEDFFAKSSRIIAKAKKTFNEQAAKSLAARRKRFAYSVPFVEGQWVLYSQVSIKDGMKIEALLPRKVGPFKIKEVRKGFTYVLDVDSCSDETDREVVRRVQTRDRGINGELLTPFRNIPTDSDWENDILDDELSLTDGNTKVPKDLIISLIKAQRSGTVLRVLDIFSGTKSLLTALQDFFPGVKIEYTSWDWDAKFTPTHCADICDWKEYINTLEGKERDKFFTTGYFDFIWISPDCAPRSNANTTGFRDLELSKQQILAAADFVEFLKPRVTCMENPESSRYQLRDAPFIKDVENRLRILPYSTTYCCYNFPYKKPTTIWSSVPLNLLHCRNTPCPAMKRYGYHLYTAQAGPSKTGTPGTPKNQTYAVPPLLMMYILLQSLLLILEIDVRVAP